MMDKKQLRIIMRQRRREIYQKNGREINQKITAQLLAHPVYQRAEKLFIYLSVKDEADTYPIIEDALSKGKQVYVPVCLPATHTMQCVRLKSLAALVPGKYQIPEPASPHQIAEKNCIGLCIVPGLAFDRKGHRLGYGGGYYDRFLDGYTGSSFGLCYAGCMQEQLPRQSTDKRVDGIFTETGFFPASKK